MTVSEFRALFMWATLAQRQKVSASCHDRRLLRRRLLCRSFCILEVILHVYLRAFCMYT